MIILLQGRALSNSRLLSSLAKENQISLDTASLREFLRGPLASAMTGASTTIPLNGTPIEVTYQGRIWQVAVQDVDGLIDLNLASESQLMVLGTAGRQIFDQRSRTDLASAAALLPTNVSVMTSYGVRSSDIRAVQDLTTIGRQSARLNLTTVPAEIFGVAARLLPADIMDDQVTEVLVELTPIEKR